MPFFFDLPPNFSEFFRFLKNIDKCPSLAELQIEKYRFFQDYSNFRFFLPFLKVINENSKNENFQISKFSKSKIQNFQIDGPRGVELRLECSIVGSTLELSNSIISGIRYFEGGFSGSFSPDFVKFTIGFTPKGHLFGSIFI